MSLSKHEVFLELPLVGLRDMSEFLSHHWLNTKYELLLWLLLVLCEIRLMTSSILHTRQNVPAQRGRGWYEVA